MLFIPQEIKEKLAKLEEENARLRNEIGVLQDEKNTPAPAKKPQIWPGIVLGLLILALGYIGFMHWQQWQNGKTPLEVPTTESVIMKDGEIEKWNAEDNLNVVYRVQLGAYENFDIEKYKQNLDGLHTDSIDGYRKISLGAFSRLADAQQFLHEMLRLGLENSFVVAYKNNEPIGIIEAKKEEQP